MRIVRLEPGDEEVVLAGATLFDVAPRPEWTAAFLAREDHHLLVALHGDGTPVGFVSGVETSHPDKGTEMFLYELSVDAGSRRQGIGRALVAGLAELARERGCYAMWVGVDGDNVAALATYRSAGGGAPAPCVTITWDFR